MKDVSLHIFSDICSGTFFMENEIKIEYGLVNYTTLVKNNLTLPYKKMTVV